MALGILGAGLIGGGIGGLAGLFKPKTKTVSTLDPYQQQLQQALGGSLNTAIAAGPRGYTGQLSSSIGQGELDSISNFNRLAALGGNSLESLININPQFLNDQFDAQIARPTFRRYADEVLPLIEEGLPSFSIARGQTRANALRDVEENLMAQRFGAQESARDRALQAIQQAQSLGVASLGINAAPREIAQAGLDRQYNDYIRGNEQYAKDIGNALSFLGIQTTAQKESPSTMSSVLSGALSGAGAGVQIGTSLANNRAIEQYLRTLQGGG